MSESRALTKGILFLEVCAISLAFGSLIFFTGPITSLLKELAKSGYLNLNRSFLASLEQLQFGSPTSLILLGVGIAFFLIAARDAYQDALVGGRQKYPDSGFDLSQATSGSYIAHLSGILSLGILAILSIIPGPPAAKVLEIQLISESSPSIPKPKIAKVKSLISPAFLTTAKPVISGAGFVPHPQALDRGIPFVETSTVNGSSFSSPLAPAPLENAGLSDSPQSLSVFDNTDPSLEESKVTLGEGVQKDVDFDPYFKYLQRRIKRNWYPPKCPSSRRIKVRFNIRSDGSMANLRLTSPSDSIRHDKASLEAVANAAPFAPLPEGAPESVDIEFTYDYNLFSGAKDCVRLSPQTD